MLVNLRKGEAVSQEPAACVAIVLSGVVEVRTDWAAGEGLAVAHCPSGSLLGAHGAFLPPSANGRAQSWRARGDVRLLCIPRTVFTACFWDDPAMAASVRTMLAEGINLLLDELACATLLDARAKVARRLVQLCAGQPAGRQARFAEVSQAELGRMLGLSRQSVNAALNDLQAAGLVRVHRFQVEILSPGRLRAQLDERPPQTRARAGVSTA